MNFPLHALYRRSTTCKLYNYMAVNLHNYMAQPVIDRAFNGITNEDVIASIFRTTGGNFRLLHRLLTQVARVLEVNKITTVTSQVVETARDSLVIGAS